MLLTIEETAEELKVSDRHVRRMISLHRWPHYRLGPKTIRLDLQEILATGWRGKSSSLNLLEVTDGTAK